MENQSRLPARKNNRLKDYDYSSCGAYFITICTKDKKCIFWKKEQNGFVGEDIILPQNCIELSPYGKIADNAINAIPLHYQNIELLQYVIMPNHIHLILFIPYNNGKMISSPTIRKSVLTAVGQMKRHVSKAIGQPIWQKSFHDHIIRNGSDYEKIAKYIYENPIKWHCDCFYTEQ
ncbi:MAG: transposase [Clostridia bacterium]|nr:transposase [Clostridia bacterium]